MAEGLSEVDCLGRDLGSLEGLGCEVDEGLM